MESLIGRNVNLLLSAALALLRLFFTGERADGIEHAPLLFRGRVENEDYFATELPLVVLSWLFDLDCYRKLRVTEEKPPLVEFNTEAPFALVLCTWLF